MIIKVNLQIFNQIGILNEVNPEEKKEPCNVIPFACDDENIYIFLDDNRIDVLRENLSYEKLEKTEIPKTVKRIAGDFLINQFVGEF